MDDEQRAERQVDREKELAVRVPRVLLALHDLATEAARRGDIASQAVDVAEVRKRSGVTDHWAYRVIERLATDGLLQRVPKREQVRITEAGVERAREMERR